MRTRFRAIATWLALAAILYAQQAPPPAAASAPAPVKTAPAAATVTPAAPGRAFLQVENASLTEVIDILARQLKINYIIDPRIKGTVTVKTYGELRAIEPRSLLDTILRVNGAAMVQVGDLYRIVPLADASRLPLRPQVNPQTIPEDEQVSLNLIFLKYATVVELSKLLEKFVGEGATMIIYESGEPAVAPRQQPQHAPDHGVDRPVRQRRPGQPAREAVRGEERQSHRHRQGTGNRVPLHVPGREGERREVHAAGADQ